MLFIHTTTIKCCLMQMCEDIWPQSLLLVLFFYFYLFFQVDDEESFIWTLIWPFFDVLVDVVEVMYLWENISCNFLYRNWTYFCLILLIVLSDLFCVFFSTCTIYYTWWLYAVHYLCYILCKQIRQSLLEEFKILLLECWNMRIKCFWTYFMKMDLWLQLSK